MLLRRVIEHVREQNWTAISIDFVIVVIGVFVGLQVQEWSQGRADRQSERQIVQDLLADLELDRSNYASAVTADEGAIVAAATSLAEAGLAPIAIDRLISRTNLANYTLDVSRLAAVPADRRDLLWTDVVSGYFPIPNTVTYDAMVGAGDLKIINNRDIVRELQTYHALTGTVNSQNAKLLALRANTLSVGATYGLAPFATMPEQDYFNLVANSPQLAATIRIQATFAIFHRGEAASADARAARLQQHLKDYLKAEE